MCKCFLVRYFGRIKGVPEADLDTTAITLLRRLGLSEEDAGKLVGTYSGGMKRLLGVKRLEWNAVNEVSRAAARAYKLPRLH